MQRQALGDLCSRLLNQVQGRELLNMEQVDELDETWLLSECHWFGVNRQRVENWTFASVVDNTVQLVVSVRYLEHCCRTQRE
ncbi:DUF659 domain-containing protein [Plasmodiophora brassicae]